MRNSKKKELNSRNGITLISLVITIIVLLILAGATVTIVLSGDGLFSKANRATTEWNEKAKNETTEIDNLMDSLYEIIGEVRIEKATGTGDLSEGDGSEENPYKIQSIEDLCTLSKNVEDRISTYQNEFFILERNLDFQNEDSYIDPNGTTFGDVNNNGTVEGLITELTTGEGFKSIGYYGYSNSYPFMGIFNGNNKTIVNLYKNNNNAYQGLFNFADGAKLKNLNLKDLNIQCSYEVGGIIGACTGNVEIDNTIVSGRISGNDYISGFVGYSSTDMGGILKISNSKNMANITASSTEVGGFVGGFTGTGHKIIIENCINNGEISGNSYTGGIIGYQGGNETEITNCINTGKITTKGSYGIGGLIGYIETNTQSLQIDKCYNDGELVVTSDSWGASAVGGLIGHSGAGNTTITNSYNKQDIVKR